MEHAIQELNQYIDYIHSMNRILCNYFIVDGCVKEPGIGLDKTLVITSNSSLIVDSELLTRLDVYLYPNSSLTVNGDLVINGMLTMYDNSSLTVTGCFSVSRLTTKYACKVIVKKDMRVTQTCIIGVDNSLRIKGSLLIENKKTLFKTKKVINTFQTVTRPFGDLVVMRGTSLDITNRLTAFGSILLGDKIKVFTGDIQALKIDINYDTFVIVHGNVTAFSVNIGCGSTIDSSKNFTVNNDLVMDDNSSVVTDKLETDTISMNDTTTISSIQSMTMNSLKTAARSKLRTRGSMNIKGSLSLGCKSQLRAKVLESMSLKACSLSDIKVKDKIITKQGLELLGVTLRVEGDILVNGVMKISNKSDVRSKKCKAMSILVSDSSLCPKTLDAETDIKIISSNLYVCKLICESLDVTHDSLLETTSNVRVKCMSVSCKTNVLIDKSLLVYGKGLSINSTSSVKVRKKTDINGCLQVGHYSSLTSKGSLAFTLLRLVPLCHAIGSHEGTSSIDSKDTKPSIKAKDLTIKSSDANCQLLTEKKGIIGRVEVSGCLNYDRSNETLTNDIKTLKNTHKLVVRSPR